MAAASRGAAGSPAPPPPSGTSLGAATASVAAAGGFNVDLALQAQRDALSLERRQDVLEDGLGLGSALRPYALASDHVYLLCSADEVTRWLIDHVAAPLAEGAGGYTINVHSVGLAIFYDVERPPRLPGDVPYYALALGTAASAALLLPTALFDVRQEDPDDPNSPHTAVPRQLPALLAELLEDEDCIKAMDHPVPTSAATSAGGVVTEPLQPTMVAARLADDFRTLEPSSLVSVQQFVAGRRDDAVQLSVQPSSATLQELAALHLGEFLPPVDSAAARKVYTAKLSRPPLLTEIRLLALRAHAAARLYAEAADWSSSHYVPVT